MATEPESKKVVEAHGDVERHSLNGYATSFGKGDILQLEHTDPVLNAKMHLVNNVCSYSICSIRLVLGKRYQIEVVISRAMNC